MTANDTKQILVAVVEKWLAHNIFCRNDNVVGVTCCTFRDIDPTAVVSSNSLKGIGDGTVR